MIACTIYSANTGDDKIEFDELSPPANESKVDEIEANDDGQNDMSTFMVVLLCKESISEATEL